MRLTNQVTILNFPSRRKASGDFHDLESFFEVYQNQHVKFRDEAGRPQEGILVDLLGEGVFVIKTRDGKRHDVLPNRINWEDQEYLPD
jgi:hypothetical protein